MRKFSLLRKVNFPLIIGLCIVLLLGLVSLYPERFATSDPYGKETLQYEKDGGKFLVPPVPPGEDYVWGTDEKGRDLRSLIIYGCSATMTMALGVAFGRLLIALPLAMAAAYKNKFSTWLIHLFNITFSAFPMVMLILILSAISLFTDLFSNPMASATFIMTIFGWSKLAKLLTKNIEDVLNEEFIEGEIAIGKTKFEIVIQNVVPHIIPSLVVLFFLEIGVVLLLLSQVGVLGLVLSSGYVNEGTGSLNVPYEFDWASLLVFSNYLFSTFKTWLIFYPAAAFSVSIIGFNMLGEGLRIEFDKRDSRIISFIKRIPGHLSPLKLIYELKNFNLYRRSIYCKLLTIFTILLIIFFPQPQSPNSFNSAEAFAAINDFGGSQFKYREYKVGRNVIAMNYIAEKLEAYGIQPFDNKYIHEMIVEEIPEIANTDMNYRIGNKEEQQLIYSQDYILAEPTGAEGTYELEEINFSKLKEFSWLYNASGKYENKVIILDIRGMEYRQINSIINDVRNFIKPKGVIFIEDWNSTEGRGNRTIYVNGMESFFTVLIAADKGELLLDQKEVSISVKFDIEVIKNVLRANVMGVIPGKDPLYKDDIILIGTNINNITDNMGKGTLDALKASGTAIQLELAKMLGGESVKPDRTVIFAFWDESNRFNKGAGIFSDRYIDRSKNDIFYIDIGNLTGDKLIIDSSGIKPKNKKGQSYVRDLKASLKSNDIAAVFRSINNSAIGTFISSKQEVLAFDSGNLKYVEVTKAKRKGEVITREDLIKFHKIGQMIIDTVFDIIYDERK
ncbi:MAG: binding-protein-dependent transport system inner rane component [Clostridia bacterium]|jgi:peptide/nickel transport system permease protein|nr:binding-protein-dependent transport system inner rane component [Clostridia bacterium]